MTTPSTPDLVAQLLAAIDETERAARFVLSDYASHEASWTVLSTGVVQLGDDLLPTGDGPLGEHIARNDPAAALRRCQADRDLIAEAMSWAHHDCEDGYYSCPKAILPSCFDACDCGTESRRQAVLHALAVGYDITEDGTEWTKESADVER